MVRQAASTSARTVTSVGSARSGRAVPAPARPHDLPRPTANAWGSGGAGGCAHGVPPIAAAGRPDRRRCGGGADKRWPLRAARAGAGGGACGGQRGRAPAHEPGPGAPAAAGRCLAGGRPGTPRLPCCASRAGVRDMVVWPAQTSQRPCEESQAGDLCLHVESMRACTALSRCSTGGAAAPARQQPLLLPQTHRQLAYRCAAARVARLVVPLHWRRAGAQVTSSQRPYSGSDWRCARARSRAYPRR